MRIGMNLFCYLLAVVSLSGCFRYVRARSEIASESPKNQSSESSLLGADAFHEYESGLKKNLDAIIQSRAAMVVNHSQDSYTIGPGDILEFDVFGLPNLRSEVEISPSGTGSFPLLSEEVPASGKTIFALKQDLRSRLTRYIKNPQLKLSVIEFKAHKVAVTGAVAKPGLYPLHRNAPLLSELIAEAGGRTEKAGNRVLFIPVAADGTANSVGVELDFEDLIGSAAARPVLIPLRGGDTIIVPEAGTIEIEGEVKNPGSYKITGKKTVMGAIAAAGGFGYAAKVNEVEVIRDIGAGKKAFVALNLEDIALKGFDDVRVRDGDLIRVPTQSGRHIERQIVEGINAIFRGVGVQGRMN